MSTINSFVRRAVAIGALATTAATASAQVTVPDRSPKPVFSGQPAAERSPEVTFDAKTGAVSLKLSVQDVNGFFIPNLRRNNFAVFEDGQRQHNVTVEIEHSPITMAVLMEMGGRSQQLNKTLATDAPNIARPVVDVLGRNDELALFTYDDRLHSIVDFDAPHDKWDGAFTGIPQPQFSEANFYDAAIQVLDRLAGRSGGKAVLIISTGIDTFSHADFEGLLKRAEAANTPVYVISLGTRYERRRSTGRAVLWHGWTGIPASVSSSGSHMFLGGARTSTQVRCLCPRFTTTSWRTCASDTSSHTCLRSLRPSPRRERFR